MAAFNVPAAILFSLMCSCAVLSSLFLLQEIGEVNRKLSDAEQISYWGMHPGKMDRIKSEYMRLYPTGNIDRVRRVFQYATFSFAFLLLIPLGFFK